MVQFASFFAVFLFLGCTPTLSKSAGGAPEKRTVARLLEQAHAEYRSQWISNIQYDLQFDITRPDFFTGKTKIDFFLKKSVPLTVDFTRGKVLQLKINGQVRPVNYNEFFLTLEAKDLIAGRNIVEIDYEHSYSTTGVGLYRFVDPVDKKTYLYSDHEPYDANLLFPCFDQPDLKATFSTVAKAPRDWQVVSTTLEKGVEDKDGFKYWTFPRSKKISTYVYSLHAGPYKVWQSVAATPTLKIPLRLMARQSMAKYVDIEEWFTTTKQGFSFFEKYFAYPYPFEKYDQVIVADFNSGAMENVAAVTFNEGRYLSRGKKQRIEKKKLANVILHEMAHMWFGNLVTMKWWNDIWLNESFATYAAYLGMLHATEYKEASVDFLREAKKRAYYEDQLVTTHPIAFDVANTEVVFANFDSITYGKGASTLKQLSYYLGEENFKKGLKNYFVKYAFGNASLQDFMAELTKASGKDLTSWQDVWLKQAQLNTLKVTYQCVDGQTQNVELKQSAPEQYPTLRPRKTQVAALKQDGPKITLAKTSEVILEGEKASLSELNGIDCKSLAFFYPNFGDHDYAKVDLDEASLKVITEKLSSVQDPLLRTGLWVTLWEMVLAQKISATDYLQTVINHSGAEQSLDILVVSLSTAEQVLQQYLKREGESKAQRDLWVQKFSQLAWEQTQKAQTVDLQKIWFSYFVANVETEKDLQLLSGFLQKTPAVLKFPIDQDRRWSILQTLAQHDYKNIQALLKEEVQKDSSAQGEKSELAVRASLPQLEVKKEFWQKVTAGPSKDMPLGKLRSVIGSLFPPRQEDLHKSFADDFLGNLKGFKAMPQEYISVYMGLTPSFCATESVNKLREFLAENKDLPPNVLKSLKAQAYESERCIGIRQKIEATKSI